MKKKLVTMSCLMLATGAMAQYASQTFESPKLTDRTVYFSTSSPGQYLPIVWGLDTAWPDEANMRRGVRFIGAENIGVARVSFQPWDFLLDSPTLTWRLENNLKNRLRLVQYIGGPGQVQLVLNNDGPIEECDIRYQHPATDPNALKAYCNLIYGTMLSCQEKGWEVITASPLNEPDYEWNGQGNKDDFLAIAKMLKTEYPQFKDGTVRISGGNTLNCDQALPWYEYLYDYIDEGNTHQLAGEFDQYAEFFERVRADGKYATADELHNVMEAIVGVEYGMQTGIWWGTAEYARGEFCKASFGERLGYAEDRGTWTAAAVYRNPQGGIQAFAGTSERQAKPSSYRFVSQDRDVFFNGYGPCREYVVDLPGGFGYQEGQTNAECVVDITWGEDVSPIIDGNYKIMNKYSEMMMGIKGNPGNLSELQQFSAIQSAANLWEVKPVPNTIGGDFSYHTFKLAMNNNLKLDVINWSLEEKGGIILYDGGLGANEQWYLKYAGDGYFRIFSRHSNLCLQLAEDSKSEGVKIVQCSPSDNPSQLWRFMPLNAICETKAPEMPTMLETVGNTGSVKLTWTASVSGDVASYTVARAEAGSSEFNTIGRNITGTDFLDNTAVPGISYEYKVKAIDRAGNSSAYTAPVEGTVAQGMNLVARYMFNDNLVDDTDNHLDCTLSPSTTLLYEAGREDGKSLRLYSRSFVQIPRQAVNHENMTIGGWINLQSKSSQCLFSMGSGTDSYINLSVNPEGTLKLTAIDGEKSEVVTGGETLKEREWHHVAVTITTGRTAIFIDGQLVAEGNTGINASSINPVLNYFGRDLTQNLGGSLNARLQDWRVYNYAVADASMVKLMDSDINGISSIQTDVEVCGVEYYTPSGVRLNAPTTGINIVRRIYTDGSVRTSKVLNK